MYRQQKNTKGTLRQNKSYKGETIEQKVNRIVNNKEPIKDGAPLVYTDRKEGIKPEYDIRTDRFEIAVEAMDKVTAAAQAKRENTAKMAEKLDAENKKLRENTVGEPIQGTES